MDGILFLPRLLVVEPQEEIRDILQTLLIGEGYEVQTVSWPEQALVLLNKQTFQCILTDLFKQLGSDWFLAIEPLCRAASPTPVGLLTAWPLTAEEARRHGFAFLVLKPFDIEDLLATLVSCLRAPHNAERQHQNAGQQDVTA